VENFEKLKKTMDEALERELGTQSNFVTELKEIERLDIENTFRLGINGNFLEVLGVAIETTKASINLLKTTARNLERPLTAEEDYIIQETLVCLNRIHCFYVRGLAAGTQFEEISGAGYVN
jgi:hypothetical protein